MKLYLIRHGETDWNSLYAGLAQNLHWTYDEIDELTIGQLEDLYDGIAKNNETADNSSGDKTVLKDADAMQFFIDHNGQI